MTQRLRGYQGPDQFARDLALVTDAQLAADIRTAAVAVGWWCDAWWVDARPKAERHDVKRAEMVETMRTQIASLGAAATVDELAAAATPLLGAYWPSYPQAATNLAMAVELLRDVIMHRLINIRRARADVERWDSSWR